MKHWGHFTVGVGSLGLGAVGVVLPGLPTTPFVLVALYCLARSHPPLYAWLEKSRFFAKAVKGAQAFKKNGSIPLGVKIFSQLVAWTSFTLSALSLEPWHHPVIIATGGAALLCTVAMLALPTAKE